MPIFKRLRGLVGRIWNSTLANPEEWFVEWAGGAKSTSGERVNEVIAMGLSAYIACIKNISEDVAKLPLGIYKRLDPRGREYQASHAVTTLLHDAANDEMSAMTFRETLTQHALGWQGGFAEIVTNGAGVPAALWPLDPTTVSQQRDPNDVLYYRVSNVPMPARSIFHIKGLSYDGLTGYVLARLAKDVIGNALAAQKFSGSFFANGTTTSGVVQVPDAMSETAFKHLRESFAQRYGGTGNQHKPVILEEGATFNPTSTDPEKSQLITVLQNGVEEVARLFRMPPHKIGHLLRATFSNIEMQALEYVQDTLLAWLIRWEQEIWRKLLLPRERKQFFAKHNVNMLLRGDSAARSAFYRETFNIGMNSVNDLRELEDQNPVDGGDAHFVNAALVPLEMAAAGEHLATNQPVSDPNQPPPDNKPDDTTANASLREHRRELLARVGAAHTKSLEAVIASTLRVEHDKVLRAAKKPDFGPWAAKFYAEDHKIEVKSRLAPVIGALSQSLSAITEAAAPHG